MRGRLGIWGGGQARENQTKVVTDTFVLVSIRKSLQSDWFVEDMITFYDICLWEASVSCRLIAIH